MYMYMYMYAFLYRRIETRRDNFTFQSFLFHSIFLLCIQGVLFTEFSTLQKIIQMRIRRALLLILEFD